MILHDSRDPYVELIQATAQSRTIPEIYVEKDYWVTRALKRLHESEYKDDVVFKGGTALSKAYQLIERFSEDIDLAVRTQDMGDSRRKRLMKGVEKAITQDLKYKEDHPLESKHGRFRKTAYAFPTYTDVGELGQVADTILVEINALADPEPATLMPISTLVHDFLSTTGREDLIAQYELECFDVLILSVERTLCEKVMGLVRASYEADPQDEFKERIRHFYDIVMILREPAYQTFVASDEFLKVIEQVKESDRLSIPNAAVWLDPPLNEAMLFAKTDALWSAIGSEFHGSFKDMLYGDTVPDDDEVLACLVMVKNALPNM